MYQEIILENCLFVEYAFLKILLNNCFCFRKSSGTLHDGDFLNGVQIFFSYISLFTVFIYEFIYLIIYLFIYLLIYEFIYYLLTYLSSYLFERSFTFSFIYIIT